MQEVRAPIFCPELTFNVSNKDVCRMYRHKDKKESQSGEVRRELSVDVDCENVADNLRFLVVLGGDWLQGWDMNCDR